MKELVNTKTQDVYIDVSAFGEFEDMDELHIPANLAGDDVDNFHELTEKQWDELEGCLPVKRMQQMGELRVNNLGDGRSQS